MTAGPAHRAEIEADQLRRLHRLVEALLPDNRFYRRKLRGDAAPPYRSLDDFRARVPFTTKSELVEDQSDHPPFGSNLTFPVEHYGRFSQTSGTTGQPLRWLDTRESWDWMVENWVRVYEACGVTSGDRLLFAFSFGPFLGFWTAFEAATRIGCLCLPGGGLSSAGRLQTIIDNQVTVLCCTPTYALHLGEMAAEEGWTRAAETVRALIVAGEPGAAVPSTRRRIEALWPGARLYDHHGMTEVGPVSYPCPVRPNVLHVMEDRFIAEIADPSTGRPLEMGREGELVLTNLGRVACPVLRYRTGDRVRPSVGRCACGTFDLSLEGGILSRVDDMLVVRGVNLYPSAIEEVVRRYSGVAEYRVEVDTRTALPQVRLQVEPRSGVDSHRLITELEGALHRSFSLRIPVQLVDPGSLPRFELKARRWIKL